jgi:hypothetical protein
MDNADAPVQLVLPQATLSEVQAVADEERRAVTDVILELVESALAQRRWRAMAAGDRAPADELALPDDDAAPMTEEYRQTIRAQIEEGLTSLRNGEGTDGEAFFRDVYAELDEIALRGASSRHT